MPKVKPPPEEAAGAAGVVAWTLVGPNVNPLKELPVPAVRVADRAVAGGATAAGATAAGAAVRVADGATAGAAAGWEA